MIEFECCECEIHVYAIVAEKVPQPPLCATCLSCPGWTDDFELRRVFGAAPGAPWPFP